MRRESEKCCVRCDEHFPKKEMMYIMDIKTFHIMTNYFESAVMKQMPTEWEVSKWILAKS